MKPGRRVAFTAFACYCSRWSFPTVCTVHWSQIPMLFPYACVRQILSRSVCLRLIAYYPLAILQSLNLLQLIAARLEFRRFLWPPFALLRKFSRRVAPDHNRRGLKALHDLSPLLRHTTYAERKTYLRCHSIASCAGHSSSLIGRRIGFSRTSIRSRDLCEPLTHVPETIT